MKAEFDESRNVKGIKIRTVNYIMIVVSVLLYLILLYVTIQISQRYQGMVSAVDNYIENEEEARLMQQGSDYLTEQVRVYVMTGDVEYMKAYFEEVNVTKRRDTALERLQEQDATEKAEAFLGEAIENSQKLSEREKYAMKLVSEAYGYSEDSLPDDLRGVELKAEDEGLDEAGKLEKGREMVFDAAYQSAKELVTSNVTYFTEEAVSLTKEAEADSAAALEQTLFRQRIYISMLFVLNVITFIIVILLVIKPLQVYLNCIKEEKRLEIVGSYEFQYLALTYNDIYELNAENEEILRYRAEHDALTGVINRGGFDKLRMIMELKPEPIALLLVDIDKFKMINDNYGHEIGDRVLKRVAKLLVETFRAHDFIARIGGDEFAVIMTETTWEMKQVIRRKVDMMNETLMNPRDDLPKASLSIGVAFSAKGFHEVLYSQADSALYVVKEQGRCGCIFYERK